MSDHYEMRIADLEEQIVELEEKLESYKTKSQFKRIDIQAKAKIEKLRKERDDYKGALEFYADPLKYNKYCKKGPLVDDLRVVQASDCEVLGDDMGYKLIGAGKRARQALSKQRESE